MLVGADGDFGEGDAWLIEHENDAGLFGRFEAAPDTYAFNLVGGVA